MSLPSPDHYQYVSHMFHSKQMLPYENYTPAPNWDYPELDRARLERVFLTDESYIKDCNVVDLGCHTGYFAYVAKTLGAKSAHGVNARQFPLDVAEYAYSQLGQTDLSFERGNLEDLDFLKRMCAGKDTVLFSGTLEHLRNPYAIIETISNSDAKNLIIESSIFSDEGEPAVKYYTQSTGSAFTVYDNDREIAIGSEPNAAWFDMVLYFFNWRIEYHTITHYFYKNNFAVPSLTKDPPKVRKTVIIHCKKFEDFSGNNHYED
jgi:Methyltransferase domain